MRRHCFEDMEERNPPKKLSESDILQQMKDIDVTFQKPVKMNDRRKRNRERSRGESSTQQWKKKIIFFQLSYWEFNPLPNNLDIMHIEKNVFDNVLYSMLNETRKSKDHVKARKNLQDMGIRPDLWPDEKEESRLAAFAIPTKKRAIFLKNLKNISMPDGYSSHFKSFVKNKSQAEGYMVEEALTFCSHYFEDIESRVNRPKRVNDESYQNKASNRSSMFPRQDIADTISTDLQFLARGPSLSARRFSAYNINGFKFRTLSREQGLKTQNIGVFLTFDTSYISFNADRNARQAELPYYGKLEDIIKLNYYSQFRFVLFKCQWADTTRDRRFKKDVWNFNCVNFSKLIQSGDREDHDPYIEASQANLVYYVDDETDKGWSVALNLKPRDLFDIGEDDEEEIYENESYQQQEYERFFDNNYENIQIA
ncbi:hypothetical protein BC332_27461 [Capsicum chinense]|nr:hypothetical protein BC332_27461 [Capsicum chinense]